MNIMSGALLRTALPLGLLSAQRTVPGTSCFRLFCNHRSPGVAPASSGDPKQDAQTVRVRFAPSPTGLMHLGGLRTALYNYLYAKAHGGQFVLRIEDTDRERFVKGATEKLYADLKWAGVEPDEDPFKGGPYGPYTQSQRYDIYKREVKKLMEDGRAYYCFCTERRLELLRKEALRLRQVPKYDNKCRHLTPGQVAERLAKNDKFCIRFQLHSKGDEFNDLIFGKIVYFIAQQEGDPVIIKSDGYPTYHFANVVDDHYMRITHVLRGVEWQISTPKHIQLFHAFGWRPPQYAHLPLIMNPNGTKLSKRQGDVHLEHYRNNGTFPQALLNYVTQSGGGFGRELLEIEAPQLPDLVRLFDLSKINANSSRLNPELLKHFNRAEIRYKLENDSAAADQIVRELTEMVRKEFPSQAKQLQLDPEHVREVLTWSLPRIDSLNDLVRGKLSFLWVLPKPSKEKLIDTDILALLAKNLSTETDVPDFCKAELSRFIKAFAERNHLAFEQLMKALRTGLSGLQEGPSVPEMMEILGREKTVQRIVLAAGKRK
ncbi:probable glutamate--tRNA ligase, mitochondrial isoform X1 [Anopheles bellator]|uniref:probable glutamate--tRNA ligase, mitochondrial isoform X1 n=1 Tax=Anopheles bellator TaxID=139047 RepID=UPI002649AC8A|nr:probable glutamate--tRNA ligase, mitochondrial isoform X1 [Anopheles bellator]